MTKIFEHCCRAAKDQSVIIDQQHPKVSAVAACASRRIPYCRRRARATDNRPSLATVLETSEWYVKSKDRGAAIVEEVLHETKTWRRAAQALKIARADIELTGAAFAESDA